MSSNCLVFHISGGNSSSPAAFLFLIFLRTESSSSCVNGPSLMSNCLLIILVIGSCIIFYGFPSKFSKCCFHSFILSGWFAAFSFALGVFFLLLTSCIVCQGILDCLSSTESLNTCSNTGRLSCFTHERVNQFLASVHGDTKREIQFLKVYANHIMLTPPQRAAYLVMFMISVSRDQKKKKNNYILQRSKSNSLFQRQNPTDIFQQSKSNWPFSKSSNSQDHHFWHYVIHTSVPFPAWGLIMTNGDCHILWYTRS